MTLYRDAHVRDAGERPDIPLANGTLYKDLSCWDTLKEVRAWPPRVILAGEEMGCRAWW